MALHPSSTDSTPDKLVFNRTVTLRDAWARIEKAMKGAQSRKGERASFWTESGICSSDPTDRLDIEIKLRYIGRMEPAAVLASCCGLSRAAYPGSGKNSIATGRDNYGG